MSSAFNTDGSHSVAGSRDATHRRRLTIRFSLRTLLLALTVVAIWLGYFGWSVRLVRQRQQLLRTQVDNCAFVVMLWEDNPRWSASIKGGVEWKLYELFDGWQKPKDGSTDSVVRVGPSDGRKLSLLRRWLGDRRVGQILLTDDKALALYHEAFPEAHLAVFPAAEAAIADWERRTKSNRRQLTTSR